MGWSRPIVVKTNFCDFSIVASVGGGEKSQEVTGSLYWERLRVFGCKGTPLIEVE